MSEFGLCRICEKQEASCKSHIIPRKFFQRIQGKSKGVDPYDHNFQKHGPHLQSGYWEKGILCYSCDGKIGKYDKYAYKVLPAGLRSSHVKKGPNGLKVFVFDPIKVRLFKLFLVSLLWRMSVSKGDLFKLVDLGMYEDRFLEILRNPREWDIIPVEAFLIHFSPPKIREIMLSSHNYDLDGVKTVWAFLNPWKVVIKIDDRPFPGRFDLLSIKEDQEIVGFFQEKEETPEYQMVLEMIKRGNAIDEERGASIFKS